MALMALAVKRNRSLSQLQDADRDVMAHFLPPSMSNQAVMGDWAVKLAQADPPFAGTDVYYEMQGFDKPTIARIQAQKRRNAGDAAIAAMFGGGFDANPRSYIENYSRALNAVSERARAQLADALSHIDYSQDVATVREAAIAIMQPACGASSTLAARLASEFYDGLRARFGIADGFGAEVVDAYVPGATEGAVRAFVQGLVDGKPVEQFIGKCAGRIDYETRKAANECIERNARRDPRKPKWARVPTGAET